MIYLDHHAATPPTAAVRDAMAKAASDTWANPSSTHAAGRRAGRWLEEAREQIGAAIGATPADVVLTSGGTEACNLGVRGLSTGCTHIVTTDVEHPAVKRSVARLAAGGMEHIALPVRGGVPPSAAALSEALREHTLVAVQWVNHETGTIFPVHEYASVCRARGARLFVDASQALGKVPVDLRVLNADAVAFGAQKIGGPAGAGACWVRRSVDIDPVLEGGAQERGRWPGTPDTLAMVGFGAAAADVPMRLSRQPAIAARRDALEEALVSEGAIRNATSPRTATVSNLSFRGWDGAVLVAALDVEGVCVSNGAACSSGLQAPSEVLQAMYPDEQWRAGSAVRISLGIHTTEDEIRLALDAFGRVLARGASENLNQIRGHRS